MDFFTNANGLMPDELEIKLDNGLLGICTQKGSPLALINEPPTILTPQWQAQPIQQPCLLPPSMAPHPPINFSITPQTSQQLVQPVQQPVKQSA